MTIKGANGVFVDEDGNFAGDKCNFKVDQCDHAKLFDHTLSETVHPDQLMTDRVKDELSGRYCPRQDSLVPTNSSGTGCCSTACASLTEGPIIALSVPRSEFRRRLVADIPHDAHHGVGNYSSSTFGCGPDKDKRSRCQTKETDSHAVLELRFLPDADWSGVMTEQGGFLIRRKVFAYLPALDLLSCRKVCSWFLKDANAELKRRSCDRNSRRLTCHTEYSSSGSRSDVIQMWSRINLFLQQLLYPAKHVMVLMTPSAMVRNRDVIRDLTTCLPFDCIISGGVCRDGMMGSTADFILTRVFHSKEPAVTLVLLPQHCDLDLVPAELSKGNKMCPLHSQRLSSRPRSKSRSRLLVALGATPETLEGSSPSLPHLPDVVFGVHPSLEGFLYSQGHFLRDHPRGVQCLWASCPGPSGACDQSGARAVKRYVFALPGLQTFDHVRLLEDAYGQLKGKVPLSQRGLLALQTVCVRRGRRVRTLIEACGRSFRQAFPGLPLVVVVVRDGQGESSRRSLWASLWERADPWDRLEDLEVQENWETETEVEDCAADDDVNLEDELADSLDCEAEESRDIGGMQEAASSVEERIRSRHQPVQIACPRQLEDDAVSGGATCLQSSFTEGFGYENKTCRSNRSRYSQSNNCGEVFAEDVRELVAEERSRFHSNGCLEVSLDHQNDGDSEASWTEDDGARGACCCDAPAQSCCRHHSDSSHDDQTLRRHYDEETTEGTETEYDDEQDDADLFDDVVSMGYDDYDDDDDECCFDLITFFIYSA